MAKILDQLIGNKEVLSKLLSLEEKNRLSSSYIFSGPSGIGKKSYAFGIAQKALCLNPPSPCGECHNCIRVEKNQHEEVLYIEPEGTQIKIKQVEEIHRFLSLKKIGRHRFIIINHAHLLNPQSSNSLLKILEEPPEETTFFLITHSEQSLLPTLRSRSQTISFSSIPLQDLQEKFHSPLWAIRSSQGRIDLLMDLMDPKLNEFRIEALKNLGLSFHGEKKSIFSYLKETIKDKENALKLTKIWQEALRDSLLLKKNLGPQIHEDQREILEGISQFKEQHLHALFKTLLQIENDIYRNVDRNLAFENFVLQASESQIM